MSQGKKRVSEKAPSTRQLVARTKSVAKRPALAKTKLNVAALRTHAVSQAMPERKAAAKTAFGR